MRNNILNSVIHWERISDKTNNVFVRRGSTIYNPVILMLGEKSFS